MIEVIRNCPICGGENIKKIVEQDDVCYRDGQVFSVSECLDCSLLFLDKRPPENEIGKYYDFDYQPFDSNYNYLSELFISWRTKNELKQFAKHNSKIENVLDIGCANGAYLKKLKKYSSYLSFTGVDINVPTIEKSKGSDEINFLSGNILQTELPSNHFDLVVMNHVIEHVYEPRKVLDKIYSLLRPGGLLLIKTPNFLSIERLIFGKNWYPYEIPRHIFIFSKRSVEKILDGSGYEVLSVKYEKTPNNIILSINNWLLRKNPNSKLAKLFSINNYFLLVLFLPISIILGLTKQSGRIVLLAQKKK